MIPRYNTSLPEPLRDCGVVWGNGVSMFTGEAGGGPAVARGPVADRRRAGRAQGSGADRLLSPARPGPRARWGSSPGPASSASCVPAVHELCFATADALGAISPRSCAACACSASATRSWSSTGPYLERLLGRGGAAGLDARCGLRRARPPSEGASTCVQSGRRRARAGLWIESEGRPCRESPPASPAPRSSPSRSTRSPPPAARAQRSSSSAHWARCPVTWQ